MGYIQRWVGLDARDNAKTLERKLVVKLGTYLI
ncbi:hypothetical protein SNOG_10000 [Parastagonospora nodorum SN15]|uniref:Uncharacterized protein n=1 Tax=Phaeosphaeria nodorum (strain SN15 / ATCC MYA-4574 / FGSC 10173) TaxID=321614 RepID=Q0UE14_PHANO|nr:hypothetical protein SNOG_10000 [Parastagonospora nodorum SN15]EAT82335.1 hypothetical protein SNOG_10000 [Parastagonospora nodorum SN15]